MVCSNCARIFRETGVRPEHYSRGNIATCPEPHAPGICSCSQCRWRRANAGPQPVPAPVPAPAPVPVPAPHPANVPVPAPRPAPAAVPRPPYVPPPRSAPPQVLRFVSPTSSNPRCTELASECPVCLVDFNESVASVNTSCGHRICVGCFTTMLVSNLRQSYDTKTKCPMCRITIVERARR